MHPSSRLRFYDYNYFGAVGGNIRGRYSIWVTGDERGNNAQLILPTSEKIASDVSI